jgi:hypothetical protein
MPKFGLTRLIRPRSELDEHRLYAASFACWNSWQPRERAANARDWSCYARSLMISVFRAWDKKAAKLMPLVVIGPRPRGCYCDGRYWHAYACGWS